jgi:hypothetical protein
LPPLAHDRMRDTCRTVAGVWLEGIERQHAVQLDAARAFCSAGRENVRTLSVGGGTRFAMGAVSATAVEPLKLIAVAAALSAIAIDIHRQAMELLNRRSDELTERPVRIATRSTDARNASDDQRSSNGKRQMMG